MSGERNNSDAAAITLSDADIFEALDAMPKEAAAKLIATAIRNSMFHGRLVKAVEQITRDAKFQLDEARGRIADALQAIEDGDAADARTILAPYLD